MATTHIEEEIVGTQWSPNALVILLPVALGAAIWALPQLADGLGQALSFVGLHVGASSVQDALSFRLGLPLAHMVALLALVLVTRYALDHTGMFLVEDYAVPASLAVGIAFLWFLENGTLRLSLDPTNQSAWWVSGGLLPWALLGCMAGTAVNMGIRHVNHKPALLPLTAVAREKLGLLEARYREIGSALIHGRMSLLGIIILILFTLLGILGPMLYSFDITKSPYAYSQPSSVHVTLDPRTWFDAAFYKDALGDYHIFGTDGLGQDIGVKLLHGTRVSMTIGIFAAIVSSVIGTAVGLLSGYTGGWKDEVLMRMNDVILSLPTLILLIILAAMIHKIDTVGIIIIIGLTGWSFQARVVRAQVLSVKERMFVERARAIGSGDFHIVMKHVFPNVFPLIFANTILTVSLSILTESSLAFLGFADPAVASWGKVLDDAFTNGAWTNGLYAWILVPGIMIVLVVLGFSLLGYALDEILNPKLKRR